MRFTILLLLTAAFTLNAQGHFYRQYWASFDENISNHKDGRWRVNDPQLALHENFGERSEALANGLVLLNAPENLFDLEKAELYLEMWGGHPHTADKRVTVNGKAVYCIPDYGTSEGHCIYAYPSVAIEPAHLVNGVNAFQFSCERGEGFWGHFIMDNVALRCYYKHDSLITRFPGFEKFVAEITAPDVIKDGNAKLSLNVPKDFEPRVESVEFFAKYSGFDEDGDGDFSDWHGYTFKRNWTFHIGQTTSAPFQVQWSTLMIPDQSQPIQFKAIIRFNNGFYYETAATAGSILQRTSESVKMFYCYDAPVPFWSRAGRINIGRMNIPIDPQNIENVQSQLKIWDGGEGEVEEPFKINGHGYPVTSKRSIHDVVHTVIDVNPAHLFKGDNKISLLSDTHHHGIEVLRPGPCLIIRYKNQ